MNLKNAHYGWLVRLIGNRLEQNMNNFLRPYNVTIIQSWVLLYLKETEEWMTFKQLENRFEVSQPTMAGILARLDQKNMIKTCRDEKDKRIKKVHITDEGRDLINHLEEHLADAELAIVRGFTEEEKKAFHDLLVKSYCNLVERGDEND